jgi:amidophosphoribosyltransferase
MIVISANGTESLHPFSPRKSACCVFEQIYFARPDSMIFGQGVYEVRKRLGRQLAKENPVEADVIIPVPDSGIVAALGASEEYGIPFEMGLIRNHYVGRTFIEPRQSIRDFGVKLKLNPVRAVIEDKRVVIVDDSIVRGTTSRKLVRLIRDAGAAEVHFRISSPPIIGSCRYGIDTPTREELIANQKTIDEIRSYIDADSLGYLSVTGMMEAVGSSSSEHCLACFNLEYPVDIYTDTPMAHE